MKKGHLTICLLLSIFLSSFAFAQVAYEVTMVQNLNGANLEISMYIKSTGDAWQLGGADFRVNVNSAALNLTAVPTLVTKGLWDNTNDAANYNAQFTGRNAVDGWVSMSIDCQFTGAGVTVPGTPALIGKLSVPITNTTVNSNAAWRTSGLSLCNVLDVNGTDYTANGTWTNPGSFALPVELTSFTVTSSRLNAEISWSTATEKNNYGFDIERRSTELANSSWAKVGFVQGAGTSNVQHSYSFKDASAAAGKYAYRLKQIDNDGSFKYSQTTEVEVGLAAKELTLSDNYPNPFNPTTNIEFTVAQDGRAVLQVYNTIGQQVAELYNGDVKAGRIIQARFDASNLATGIYYSRLQVDGKSIVKRMMFVK